MGLVGALNPFGHPTPLVDKMIGSGYDEVAKVANNLPLIVAVANAIGSSDVGEPLLAMRALTVHGKLGEIGSINRFALPPGVDTVSVFWISARVQIAQDAYCFSDDRFFYTTLEDGQLVLTLRNDAPIEFADASVRWFVICGI